MAKYNRKDYEAALPQLEKRTRDVFFIDEYFPQGYTFNSSEYRNIAIKLKIRDGYRPIITACTCMSHYSIDVFNYYISGREIHIEAKNTNASQATGVNFRVNVLCLKKELSG